MVRSNYFFSFFNSTFLNKEGFEAESKYIIFSKLLLVATQGAGALVLIVLFCIICFS